MKKGLGIFLLTLMLLGVVLASFASATVIDTDAHNWDEGKQRELGRDGEAMRWYLGNYGKINNTPYVIVRRYYSGNAARYRLALKKRIGSKIGKGKDANLYFTEYGYEYTEDGKHFFEIYAKHYNGAGQFLLEDKVDETKKMNVEDNFGAKKSVDFAMRAESQTKKIDDGQTEQVKIRKVDDDTGIHDEIVDNDDDDDNHNDNHNDDHDHDSKHVHKGRQWQYWNDVKDMWHDKAKRQFTNWYFSPEKTTVELVNKSDKKVEGPFSLSPVKDRGFVFSMGIEQGTQLVVPEGCELHCDPSKVDTKGKKPQGADKRGNGIAFYPGEIVYFKQTVSPGFTIFPYHAYPVD